MRALLFTGKGGVGKTTVAAGTATLAAQRGRRTLALSLDAAPSLGDAFDHPAGPEPVQVDDRLFVQHVDGQHCFERAWPALSPHLAGLLDGGPTDRLAAAEVVALPGAEEVLAVLALGEQLRSGRWDLVVVDCPASAAAVRLLAAPHVLGWYSAWALGPGRAARALLPLQDRLAEARSVLTASGTTVRLVLTPEALVVAESRRLWTQLALYGYRVDAVVANRVFPTAGADLWRAGWAAAQRQQLADVEAAFAPLPVHRSPYRASEPVGVEDLAAFAAQLYAGSADPVGPPSPAPEVRVTPCGEGFVLDLELPLTRPEDLDLARSGDDLVLTVAGCRRLLRLPAVLRRCEVAGARWEPAGLHVRFVPDPAQWMTG